jgi:hypothetical protein
MKQFFFLFAILISVATNAQSGVTVKSVSANYGNKTVTFTVSWAAGSRDATHLSKVWVWVDYQPVTDPDATGTWTRATIANPSPGTVAPETDKGFWLQGNSGSYSATVTVQLTNVPSKFNWCAYASDYPPNVTANNGSYTFHGTLPFTLTAANGTTTQTISNKTVATSAVTITPITLTDQTGCPGVFCIYTGTDLYIDATHLCQQRTVGAKNWETYIKDSRDNQIYRITQFSDGSWWFASDLAIATNRYGICNGISFYAGSNKPACPTGWSYPSIAQIRTRAYRNNDQWSNETLYGTGIPCVGTTSCSANRFDLNASDGVNTYAYLTGYGLNVQDGWNYCTGPNNQDPNMSGGVGRSRCRRP